MPNPEWGGEGSIGCGIGYGYLHRIPARPPSVVRQNTAPPPIQPVAPPTIKTEPNELIEVPLVVPSQPNTPNHESTKQSDLETTMEQLSINTPQLPPAVEETPSLVVISSPSNTGPVNLISEATPSNLIQVGSPPMVFPASSATPTLTTGVQPFTMGTTSPLAPPPFQGTTGVSYTSQSTSGILGSPPTLTLPSFPPMISLDHTPSLTPPRTQ